MKLLSRSLPLLLAAAVLSAPLAASSDHLPSVPTVAQLEAGTPVLQAGDIRFITNVQAGHGFAAPLGEHGSFARDGKRYLATSSTIYGLEVVDVTDPLAPVVVGSYAAAAGCPPRPPRPSRTGAVIRSRPWPDGRTTSR